MSMKKSLLDALLRVTENSDRSVSAKTDKTKPAFYAVLTVKLIPDLSIKVFNVTLRLIKRCVAQQATQNPAVSLVLVDPCPFIEQLEESDKETTKDYQLFAQF